MKKVLILVLSSFFFLTSCFKSNNQKNSDSSYHEVEPFHIYIGFESTSYEKYSQYLFKQENNFAYISLYLFANQKIKLLLDEGELEYTLDKKIINVEKFDKELMIQKEGEYKFIFDYNTSILSNSYISSSKDNEDIKCYLYTSIDFSSSYEMEKNDSFYSINHSFYKDQSFYVSLIKKRNNSLDEEEYIIKNGLINFIVPKDGNYLITVDPINLTLSFEFKNEIVSNKIYLVRMSEFFEIKEKNLLIRVEDNPNIWHIDNINVYKDEKIYFYDKSLEESIYYIDSSYFSFSEENKIITCLYEGLYSFYLDLSFHSPIIKVKKI